MAAATKIVSASGLRRVQVFLTDTDGYPSDDESGADGYDGERIEGVQTFTTTFPDIQILQHTGDDVVYATTTKPPTELPSASLAGSKANLNVDAILNSTNVTTVGETQAGAIATDKDGNEPYVVLLAYQEAINAANGDTAFGKERWYTHCYALTQVVPKGNSAEQNTVITSNYNIAATKSSKFPFGSAFDEAVHGYTQAAYLRFTSEYPPILERWTGNGTLDTFNVTFTPVSVAKTSVFVDGSEVTVSSVDTTNDTITLDSAPSANAKIVAWYETTDKI